MEPRWSPDGRDLYFLDGAVRLVAATVRASASGVDVTDLKPLLDASGLAVDIFHTSYDILPGGGLHLRTAAVRTHGDGARLGGGGELVRGRAGAH